MSILNLSRRSCSFAAVLALAFLGNASFAICQEEDAEVLRHFEAAKEAQKAGRYDVATSEYSKVIRLRPEIAEAYASLGLVLNATGKFTESARFLEKADRLKHNLPGVSLYLGIDYIKEKHPKQAVAHLEDAIQIEPKNREPRLWLCAALLNSGRIDEALHELHQTRLLYPDDPEILLRQGDTYRRAANLQLQQVLTESIGKPLLHQVYGDMYLDQRQWQKAEGHYRLALQEDGQWPNAHYGLGQSYLHQQELEAAEKEFSEELGINPKSAAARSMLGEIYLARGDAARALPFFDSAIRESPAEAASALELPPSSASINPPRASIDSENDQERMHQVFRQCLRSIESAAPSVARSLALAFLNDQLGNTGRAAAAWSDFQTLATQAKRPNLYGRARAAFDQKDFDATESDLNEWLKLNPSDSNARYFLARTYRNQSLTVMTKLLSIAPDSYAAHQLLGETYESADEDEKALAEYKQVEQLAPALPGIHFSIGSLLFKMKKEEEAFNELNAELLQEPDHPETNAEIGSILLSRNDPDRAIAYLRKAVEADPDLSPAHRELGKAYFIKEKYGQAEMELRQSLSDDPEGTAHYQLAMVYREIGRADAAKKMFAIARQIQFERFTENLPIGATKQDVQ